MNYPTDIVNDDAGWGRIHRGHNLTLDVLERDMRDHQPAPHEGAFMDISEVHFDYVPRVKWCGNLGIFPCDNEGEWHDHWIPVNPSDTSKFTTVYWQNP